MVKVDNIISKPPSYPGTGRPTSLTPQIQETICQYVRDGNYLITACRAVGIAEKTFYNWIERGEAEAQAGDTTGQFFAFFQAVKKAEAASEVALVAEVREHASRNVVAPLALLDRRFRERWGQTQPAQGGGNTYNFNIDKAIIDASNKFDALIKRIDERQAEPLAIPEQAGGEEVITED